MSAFTDYCVQKGKFKLVIWLEKEFGEEATGVSKRNDPWVVKYSFPGYDKKDEKNSVERLSNYFLKKYAGKYRFAQVFNRTTNQLIRTITK